ncbi:MAG: TauD/TfdA family dioxygenase [Chloroflexota bacterium]
MKTFSGLSINPITPTIGAEISGVDLSQPLTEPIVNAIYQALLEHQVIFFPNQHISPQNHLDFAKAFGGLDQPHPIYPNVPGFEQIVILENDGNNPLFTDEWHTDVTFRTHPPFATVLYTHTLPPCGGDTLWANMHAAYETLPSDVKAFLADKEAVHDMGSFRNDFIAQGGVEELNDAMRRVGSAVHPVIAHHPATGRPYINVNRSFAIHILGMATPESARWLSFLFDHVSDPLYQIRFRWELNTLAMWDNRGTQHYAVADYFPNNRRMHRVTVVNDKRVQ